MSLSSSSSLVQKTDPAYIDMLDEDKVISSQQFCVCSFVSPDEILKKKEEYFFEQFLKTWDFRRSMHKFHPFLQFVSHKYPSVPFDQLMEDFTEYVTEESTELQSINVSGDYATFVEQQGETLQNNFNAQHSFCTNLRGFKVRGSYPTLAEAEHRSKVLRDLYPNDNLVVGEVGKWLPFAPSPYSIGRIEYPEEELNQLMHEKASNEQKAKDEFERRKLEAKREAMESNRKKAEVSHNKVTQQLDEHGNLVSKPLHPEQQPNEVLYTEQELHAQLFEGDNIVVPTSKK